MCNSDFKSTMIDFLYKCANYMFFIFRILILSEMWLSNAVSGLKQKIPVATIFSELQVLQSEQTPHFS